MKLTLTFDKKSVEIPEGQNEFPIGRDHGDIKNNLNIPVSDVSKIHCTIIQDEKSAYLRDNGSKYGTFVNGKQIKDDMRATLQDGDEITLGKSRTLIIVKIDDDENEELKIADTQTDDEKTTP